MSANADHGKRRTIQDKNRAVLTLLKDRTWSNWSDRAIAKHCKVSNTFVSKLRGSLPLRKALETRATVNVDSEGPGPDAEFFRRYKDKHGNEGQMNVQNIGKPEAANKARFNKTNENIGWASWSWNPVTGCEFGCDYCYARDIAMRFDGHFKPTFHEDRLEAPKNTNPRTNRDGGFRVFVCSMADLFGAWVPDEWIGKIMETVRENPQWVFLFLTKNPKRYTSISFPHNAWIGATVDRQARVNDTEKAMKEAKARFKFVSCEPLLEKIVFTEPKIFDAFIIGARSATSSGPEFQPKWEWVMSLLRQIEDAKKMIWWKDNLARPQELPPYWMDHIPAEELCKSLGVEMECDPEQEAV